MSSNLSRPRFSTPGWVRQCVSCGLTDVHAVYPNASMLDQATWTCAACGCGRHGAVHVPFDASVCPALRPEQGAA